MKFFRGCDVPAVGLAVACFVQQQNLIVMDAWTSICVIGKPMSSYYD